MATEVNPLHIYSSYNCIFTFAVLTKDEVNFPDATYASQPAQLEIFRSGGKGESYVSTVFEDQIGGKLEYFIEDLDIQAIVVPNTKTRLTNATNISFTVLEPYSMGLFLQTLHIAALQAGYTNYLQAPFLLTIEFVGWDDDGYPITIDEHNLQRKVPLKLTNVEMVVGANGTEYAVTAIPWNEQALTDQIDRTYSDIAITGNNVVEILQTGPESLTTVVNGRYETLRQEGSFPVADEIIISFPNDITTSVSNVGKTPSASQGATVAPKKSGGSRLLGNIAKGVVGGVISGALSGEKNIGKLALGGGILGAIGGGGMTGVLNAFRSGDINSVFQSITGFLGAQAPQDFDSFLSSVTGLVFSKSDIGQGLMKVSQDSGSINLIGNGNISTNYNDSGKPPMGKSGQQYDKNNKVFTRGKNVIDPQKRAFTFDSNTKITRMIEEVVTTSSWAKELKDRPADENGMVEWFKIDAQTFVKSGSAREQQDGSLAKTYVYRVVPYKVHSSALQKPSDPGLSYEQLKATAKREYNYIYTGANLDILNFDISINAAFFKGIMTDSGQNNIERKGGGLQQNITKQDTDAYVINQASNSISGTGFAQQVGVSNSKIGGGAGIDNSKVRIAKMFNENIINSGVDLVMLDLEIMGDPYFMFDSGMGNFTGAVKDTNETENGSIEYQRSEVDVVVNFRTPIDYNDNTGTMVFPEDTIPVDSFSGLYRVTTLTNSFNKNQFTQTLKLLRRPNQPIDTKQFGTSDTKTKITDAQPNQKSYTPYGN
jgi:hypothetical protein|tara:strand:- start:77422 stop:79725 length:2304 start_codon:yes stop_codon:yes gene_type:complete